MIAKFMEKCNIKVLTIPVDLNTAAVTGGRVSMKTAKRVALVVIMGDSTAAVVTFSLKQHNASSSGTSKALSISNSYYHKAGTATKFTEVVPESATDSYDLATIFADQEGVVVFEINQEDLDVNNNFDHVSVDIADSTAAKIGTVIAIFHEAGQLPAYLQDL